MHTPDAVPEKTLRLRQMQLDDFDAVVALQLRCFPGVGPWHRSQIESQLRIFPEGQIVQRLYPR